VGADVGDDDAQYRSVVQTLHISSVSRPERGTYVVVR